MKDSRGINRGKCGKCAHCAEYSPPLNGHKCSLCNCPPAVHEKLKGDGSSLQPVVVPRASVVTQAWTDADGVNGTQLSISQAVEQSQKFLSQPLVSICSFPGCNEAVEFDMNTGAEGVCCSYHKAAHANHMMFLTDGGMEVEDLEIGSDSYRQMQVLGVQPAFLSHGQTDLSYMAALPTLSLQAGLPQAMSLPPGVTKCAIQECPNTCYVDDSGTVHECCGVTHAMEHQRRQALWQQVNQQVVKGVTHCYLPGCNRPTWPFHNYCGKTHAEQGKQMDLPPPPSLATPSSQTAAGTKDSSMCIIPECQRPKYVDPKSGVTHDFCGRTHAQEGAKRGIRATADKAEDQCDLPGCTNRKRTEGARVHEYCCLDHAQKDAPNRDARILKTDSEVQTFLKKFSNLKVVSIVDNQHAKPGGVLFQKFKKAYNSLSKNQRKTCLAFHGTSTANIDSICKTGYDPNRRKGQAYGTGEYFATSPTTPLGYCQGGKKMLLNELLLGQSGVHHTQHGDIIVMKNPEHDLPRFVISFS